MTKRKRMLIIALIALYMIAPDLLPGPVDDLLVLLLTAPAQRGVRRNGDCNGNLVTAGIPLGNSHSGHCA